MFILVFPDTPSNTSQQSTENAPKDPNPNHSTNQQQQQHQQQGQHQGQSQDSSTNDKKRHYKPIKGSDVTIPLPANFRPSDTSIDPPRERLQLEWM